MTIQTNVEDRRALVRQISKLLNTEAVYQRAPTYAYAVGPVTIDREGNIICEDAEALQNLQPLLREQEYIGQEAETTSEPGAAAEPWTEEVAESITEHNEELDVLEIAVPIEGMDGSQLRNLVYLLRGYQYLLNRVARRESFNVSDAAMTILVERTPESATEIIGLMNELKPLGELKGIDFRADAVALIFPLDESPEKNRAYTELTSAMVKVARTAKRVDAKIRQPENEKFVLRSWLLRLGFCGPDFKATRNALLSGLKGHTAFPDEDAALKHKDKYAEIRRIARETREGGAA